MAETAGAPGPRARSSKAELFGEAGPVGDADRAVVLERRERGENLGARAFDAPIPQLADHPGEPLVVSRGVHLAVLEHGAQVLQLLSDPRGSDGLERPALLIRHALSL